ncbi:MAG TPA: hypothetical protein VF817_03990 [Patescibacteria group bacterium]
MVTPEVQMPAIATSRPNGDGIAIASNINRREKGITPILAATTRSEVTPLRSEKICFVQPASSFAMVNGHAVQFGNGGSKATATNVSCLQPNKAKKNSSETSGAG